MNQDKISEFIKKIRKDNNLTQKDLADKYNVTYQAVSKWETGKNIPDISILKQMSNDYNISIDDLLEGTYTRKNNKKIIIIIGIVIIALVAILFVILSNNKYNFKTITTTCSLFEVSGSIAYDKQTSSIYISNIVYCGGDDNNNYKEIECSLYEKNEDTTKKISSNKSTDTNIKLEDYLKNVKLNIDNYYQSCKNYSDESLFLEINATDNNNKITTYRIPLTLNSNCPD